MHLPGHETFDIGKTGGILAGSIVGLVVVIFSVAVFGGCCDEEEDGRPRSSMRTVANPLSNTIQTSNTVHSGGRASNSVQNNAHAGGGSAGSAGRAGSAGIHNGTLTDATTTIATISGVLKQQSRAGAGTAVSLTPRPISITGAASVQMHAVADNNV